MWRSQSYPMGGSDPESEPREHRCPYRQDLRITCMEGRCDNNGCPIFVKESGQLAYALSQKD